MAIRKKTVKKSTKKKVDSGTIIADDIETIVNKLDKLYYEKPAGYFGYMATCASKMSVGPHEVDDND